MGKLHLIQNISLDNKRTSKKFLCSGFIAVDAYFSPVVMRLKYYGLPTSLETTQSYISSVCDHSAVRAWVDQAIATAEFFTFEEPYRLATDAAPAEA